MLKIIFVILSIAVTACSNQDTLVQKTPEQTKAQKKSKKSDFKLAEDLRISFKCDKAKKIYAKFNDNSFKEGLALCLLQEGDLKTASKILAEIVQDDASKWRSVNALGVVYSLAGHSDEAQQYFNIALEISKNNPAIMNNIALSIALSGSTKKALKTAQEALAQNPSSTLKRQIRHNIALVYGIMGEEEKSRNILKDDLTDAAIYNNLGVYAKLRKDQKLARTYLSKALSTSPIHYEKAWQNLQSIK